MSEHVRMDAPQPFPLASETPFVAETPKTADFVGKYNPSEIAAF